LKTSQRVHIAKEPLRQEPSQPKGIGRIIVQKDAESLKGKF